MHVRPMTIINHRHQHTNTTHTGTRDGQALCSLWCDLSHRPCIPGCQAPTEECQKRGALITCSPLDRWTYVCVAAGTVVSQNGYRLIVIVARGRLFAVPEVRGASIARREKFRWQRRRVHEAACVLSSRTRSNVRRTSRAVCCDTRSPCPCQVL